MVERHLPGFPPDQLPGAAAAAKEKSAEISSEGQDVRYLRSTYVPEGEKCFCLFEGVHREVVEEVQHRAGVPFEKIHDAAFLTADDVYGLRGLAQGGRTRFKMILRPSRPKRRR
jgi:hypothetical protein